MTIPSIQSASLELAAIARAARTPPVRPAQGQGS